METIEHKCKIMKYALDELSEAEQKLVQKAMKATDNSYAPYSQFRVGAAVLMDNGVTYIGANQENAAYPLGLCAERTAIFAANAQHPKNKIVALAIAARTPNGFTDVPVSPCGSCRQVILEVETRYKQPIRILLYGTEGIYVVDSVKEILPLQFTSESMC
ncbi:MAG: cytidine deaminase [Bacteroidaceae bacterium]|nr:cytidine deaminase [Bacteroidaceae bacterium]